MYNYKEAIEFYLVVFFFYLMLKYRGYSPRDEL